MSRSVSKKRKRGRPRTGRALSAAERMRGMRARRKQAGLRSVATWQPVAPGGPAPYSPHRLLEARSLAMHALIAAKISSDPALLDNARRNLERWSARWGSEVPRWALEWQHILEQPWPQIAALISEPSETAARLRQSSPFAGILTPQERRRIHEAFRA